MRLLGVHKDRQRYRAAFDVAGTRRYRSLRSKEMDAAVVEARFAEAYGIDFAGSPPTLADLVTRLIIGLSVKEETREMHWREARQMEALGMTVADLCPTGLASYIDAREAAGASKRVIGRELKLMRRAARPLAEAGICDLGSIEERIDSLVEERPRRDPLDADALDVASLAALGCGQQDVEDALGCLLALEGGLTAKDICSVRPEMIDGTTLHLPGREVRLDEHLATAVADACEKGCFIMSGTETPMSPRQATTRAANLLCAWRIDATLKDLREGSSS